MDLGNILRDFLSYYLSIWRPIRSVHVTHQTSRSAASEQAYVLSQLDLQTRKKPTMSNGHRGIEDLCDAISRNTQKVADFLSSNELPFPSFAVDGPAESVIPREASEIQKARSEVIDDTFRLRALMLGPRDYLQSFKVPHSAVLLRMR